MLFKLYIGFSLLSKLIVFPTTHNISRHLSASLASVYLKAVFFVPETMCESLQKNLIFIKDVYIQKKLQVTCTLCLRNPKFEKKKKEHAFLTCFTHSD